MTEISFTFKGGPGFDAPWVVVKAASVTEADAVLEELRQVGAFSAVKTMAREFLEAPAAGVEAVQAAIASATVISEGPASPALQAQVVQQSTPPCEKCGGATTFRSGTGKNGKWSGYFCETNDRTHTTFLKD
jgi:protein gp37